MILGELKTGHFEWTTLTNTAQEALDNLRQAWENHAEELHPNYKFEFLEDSVTLLPISLGDTVTDCNQCENLESHLTEEITN